MNQEQQTTEFVEPFEEQEFASQTEVSLQKKKWDKVLNVLLAVVLVILVCTIVIKAFFVTNVVVSGDSMFPTYTNGRVVQVSRNANEQTVDRGDVVVFYLNHPGWAKEHFDFLINQNSDANYQYRLLIKRVVALQGDKIWVEKVGEKYCVKVQTADGQILSEQYDYKDVDIPESRFYISQTALKRLEVHTQSNPYTVPQGYFFAMGDNRDQSHDSRYEDMGDIPYENLFGKVF